MTLYELLENVNENTIVEVFSAEPFESIAIYDGKQSIPEEYNDCEVTDIFSDITEYIAKSPTSMLCIEIDV